MRAGCDCFHFGGVGDSRIRDEKDLLVRSDMVVMSRTRARGTKFLRSGLDSPSELRAQSGLILTSCGVSKGKDNIVVRTRGFETLGIVDIVGQEDLESLAGICSFDFSRVSRCSRCYETLVWDLLARARPVDGERKEEGSLGESVE